MYLFMSDYLIKTPYFPTMRAQVAPMGKRVIHAIDSLVKLTPSQIESLLKPCFPASLFAKSPPAPPVSSPIITPPQPPEPVFRDRIYTLSRTFFLFLYQCLNKPNASCRSIAIECKLLFDVAHQRNKHTSEDGAAYCIARARLPLARIGAAFQSTVNACHRLAPSSSILQGRDLKAADGTTLTLNDTPTLCNDYPKSKNYKLGTGFPMMRLVVIFSVLTGAIVAAAKGSKHDAEWRLFHSLIQTLRKDDILIVDRAYGLFVVMFALFRGNVDTIARPSKPIVINPKKSKKIGRNDYLVKLKRGRGSKVLTQEEWDAAPEEMTVRVIQGRIKVANAGKRRKSKGSIPVTRVVEIQLVTTLLDPEKYPADEILEAYGLRWRLEMCLDDLKTTLGMETLRCKSSKMVEKELWMNLCAHNVLRWVILKSADTHGVDHKQISFKGTIDRIESYGQAVGKARNKADREGIWEEMLKAIAKDLVPQRPGRREPRAIKRRRNKYPVLNCHRREYEEPPKRNERRKKFTQRLRMIKCSEAAFS